jgi:peptide deformylase
MILPIVAYGSPILRKVAIDITKNYPDFDKFLSDMWETMYNSNGVGLAAPQINKSVRLFLVDTVQIVENADQEDEDDYKDEKPIKQVFINAEVLAENGEEWAYNEGCLSIPKVRADVMRSAEVTVKFLDENFEEHVQTFDGMTARVILHEYDHLEGKLFIDRVKPLKRKMLSRKLDDIIKGKMSVSYKMVQIK